MIHCEKCSTELPDDAVACYRCGTVTEATFVKPIHAGGQVARVPTVADTFDRTIKVLVVVALALIAVAGVIFAIAALQQRPIPSEPQATTPATVPPPEQTPRQPTQAPATPMPVEPMQVPPAQVPPPPKRDPRILKVSELVSDKWWQSFIVPKGGAAVRGRLEGDGGIRGEFNCYIMTDDQLTDYRNGKAAPTIFNVERLTVIDIDTWLEAGQYFLVLKNPSPWTKRRITGNIVIGK